MKGYLTYEQFYEGFYDFVLNDPYFNEYFEYFKSQHDQWYTIGKSSWYRIEGLSFHANNYLYHLHTKIHSEDKVDYVFSMIKSYLKSIDRYHEDIFELQKDMVITFDSESYFPKTSSSGTLINPNKTCENKQEFLSKLYFLRERSFGKAMIESVQERQAA